MQDGADSPIGDTESFHKPPHPLAYPDAKTALLVLFLILSVLLTVVLVGRGGAPTVIESNEALSLKAWGYRQEIPYATIDSVGLRRCLDGVRGRRNAIQSGNTFAGRFAMEPYGEAMLFVDERPEPCVVIFAKDGVTLFSTPDGSGAERVAERLRFAATRTQGTK